MTNPCSDAKAALEVRWLGRVAYARGLALQADLVARRRRGEICDQLLLLEHDPVVTLGRSSHAEHLLLGEAALAARGIERFEAGRGGDVTYHGPGQLVGYPILLLEADRRDAHRYLRDLEQALIRSVASFGIDAERVDGLTGIWVGEEKLAAIGVRFNSGWITSHGFALNVTTDLSGFETIVPCGIRGRGVTSIDRLCGPGISIGDVARHVTRELAEILARTPVAAEEPSERLAESGGQPVSWSVGERS